MTGIESGKPTPEEMEFKASSPSSPEKPEGSEVKYRQEQTVLDLPTEKRAAERVRLSLEIPITELGNEDYQYAPVSFSATREQAIAFVDMIQATTLPDKLSVIIDSPLPNFRVTDSLGARFHDGTMSHVAGGDKQEATIVVLSYDETRKKYVIQFGFSEKGTSVNAEPNADTLDISLHTHPELIVTESLVRLTRLTNDTTKFLDALLTRERQRPGR